MRNITQQEHENIVNYWVQNAKEVTIDRVLEILDNMSASNKYPSMMARAQVSDLRAAVQALKGEGNECRRIEQH